MTPLEKLPMLIEPEDLQANLQHPQLILVDLSDRDSYLNGHVPGARHITPQQTQLGQPPAPGSLPEPDRLEALFSSLGHHPEAIYVVYDNEGGGWAGRFIWLLDSIGHSRYHYLNGGRQAWVGAGLPLSDVEPAAADTRPTLQISETATATLEYIRAHLNDPQRIIWDARSPQEFRGEKVLAARGGHIPGAVNLEWTAAMDPQRNLRLREDLPQILTQLGITPDREVITHCQSHHRSGFTYLVAKILGYPRVKAYAGSWGEWGNHPDTPIESA